LILQKAQKALEAYDETTYRKILDEYQSNQKMQETIKNYANAFYLKSKSYYRELNYTQAKTQIEEAIKFDNTNEQYLHWYGYILYTLGEYDKALEYYQKALAIVEKVFGGEHPFTASSHNNIGAVYDAKGEYDKALEYYQKALAISEKILGLENPSTASSHNNIAWLYYEMQNYQEAAKMMQKAIDVLEKVLPANHPNLINAKKGLEMIKDEL